MSETYKLTAKERFSHLEDKIYRVSEIFKHLISLNNQLKEEVNNLKKKYSLLNERFQALESEVKSIRREREFIEEKVEHALMLLDAMEKHNGQ